MRMILQVLANPPHISQQFLIWDRTWHLDVKVPSPHLQHSETCAFAFETCHWITVDNMDDVSVADLSPFCLFVHSFLSSELFVIWAMMITSSIIGVRAHPQISTACLAVQIIVWNRLSDFMAQSGNLATQAIDKGPDGHIEIPDVSFGFNLIITYHTHTAMPC